MRKRADTNQCTAHLEEKQTAAKLDKLTSLEIKKNREHHCFSLYFLSANQLAPLFSNKQQIKRINIITTHFLYPQEKGRWRLKWWISSGVTCVLRW
uniref:Uncharacterized protein n=1 Tax=Salix viminalis TaxID=40686 RepID=A0A6N2KHS6_SALVM